MYTATPTLQRERPRAHARALAPQTRCAQIITDREGKIVSVNDVFEQVTGFRASEVLGCRPSVLSSGQHDHNLYQSMWRALNDAGHWRGKLINRRKNGELYTEMLEINRLPDGHPLGEGYVGAFRVIEPVGHLPDPCPAGFFDATSGLPGPAVFCQRVRNASMRVRARSGHAAVVAVALTPEALSHTDRKRRVLDGLLEQLGRRDSLARLGAGRYAVLLEDTVAASLQARLDAFLSRPVPGVVQVVTSIVSGVSGSGPNGASGFIERLTVQLDDGLGHVSAERAADRG